MSHLVSSIIIKKVRIHSFKKKNKSRFLHVQVVQVCIVLEAINGIRLTSNGLLVTYEEYHNPGIDSIITPVR